MIRFFNLCAVQGLLVVFTKYTTLRAISNQSTHLKFFNIYFIIILFIPFRIHDYIFVCIIQPIRCACDSTLVRCLFTAVLLDQEVFIFLSSASFCSRSKYKCSHDNLIVKYCRHVLFCYTKKKADFLNHVAKEYSNISIYFDMSYD